MSDQYKSYGVDSHQEDVAMGKLLDWINPTFAFRPKIGKNILPVGFFANIIDIGNGKGIALSMDGVGTKILVAEKLGKYETIGIDCVAMNVNDLLCVGAEPVSFMDYIGVANINEHQIEALAKGLHEGAKQAKVNIPGGELAQVRELLHSGDHSIDIIGTAVGIVDLDKIITGKNILPGDCIIGLPSSGIHSNGLTIARRLLLNQGQDDKEIMEELLLPTKIYVEEVMALISQVDIKGMAHITGEGFLNILRLNANAKYNIETLPPIPSIFNKIQQAGNLPDTEMFKDFNMGIGFVMIVAEKDLKKALNIVEATNKKAYHLGFVSDSPQPCIEIKPKNIFSTGDYFQWMENM